MHGWMCVVNIMLIYAPQKLCGDLWERMACKDIHENDEESLTRRLESEWFHEFWTICEGGMESSYNFFLNI